MVRSAAREVAIKCAEEPTLFDRDPLGIIDLSFQRKTYEEAIELPKPNNFPDLKFGDDLGAVEENRLAEPLGPVFITHYPKEIKFFHMRTNDDDPRVVNSSDLREKLVKSSMLAGPIRQDMKLKNCEWYLNFHEQHNVQLYSGADVGMGLVLKKLSPL